MSDFALNFFCLSGILAQDPMPAPYISKTAVHIDLLVRSPFAPDEAEFQAKFFYPLDLYVYGQQGDIVMRYFHKGSHLTVWGRIVAQKINVRGRAEGVPRLKVDGIDLKAYYKEIPTAEELGFTPAKSSGEIGTDDNKPKKKKNDFIY